jgi:hypothetical protein
MWNQHCRNGKKNFYGVIQCIEEENCFTLFEDSHNKSLSTTILHDTSSANHWICMLKMRKALFTLKMRKALFTLKPTIKHQQK